MKSWLYLSIVGYNCHFSSKKICVAQAADLTCQSPQTRRNTKNKKL